jgi:hypothetical protein
MQYGVFRFERNQQAEQWVMPLIDLLPFTSVTDRKITIPIKMSDEHGQEYNLAFQRLKPKLKTVHGFTATNVYLFFIPSITPSAHALDRLAKQWKSTTYAEMIAPNTAAQANMYRL